MWAAEVGSQELGLDAPAWCLPQAACMARRGDQVGVGIQLKASLTAKWGPAL